MSPETSFLTGCTRQFHFSEQATQCALDELNHMSAQGRPMADIVHPSFRHAPLRGPSSSPRHEGAGHPPTLGGKGAHEAQFVRGAREASELECMMPCTSACIHKGKAGHARVSCAYLCACATTPRCRALRGMNKMERDSEFPLLLINVLIPWTNQLLPSKGYLPGECATRIKSSNKCFIVLASSNIISIFSSSQSVCLALPFVRYI